EERGGVRAEAGRELGVAGDAGEHGGRARRVALHDAGEGGAADALVAVGVGGVRDRVGAGAAGGQRVGGGAADLRPAIGGEQPRDGDVVARTGSGDRAYARIG